jgi:hypothetical protein
MRTALERICKSSICMALTYLIEIVDLERIKELYPSVDEFRNSYFDDANLYKEERIESDKVWLEAGNIFDRLIDVANFSEDEKHFYFNYFSNLFWGSDAKGVDG